MWRQRLDVDPLHAPGRRRSRRRTGTSPAADRQEQGELIVFLQALPGKVAPEVARRPELSH